MNENTVTGQEKVNPEAILREACQALLKYFDGLSRWRDQQLNGPVQPYIPSGVLDDVSASALEHQVLGMTHAPASLAIQIPE
jgi:hypothetical protein